MRIFSITGCQGTEALAFARRKRSSGPSTSGLTPQDGRNDLELAAAVRTMLQVELEHTLLDAETLARHPVRFRRETVIPLLIECCSSAARDAVG
jgi:hypothetical protein